MRLATVRFEEQVPKLARGQQLKQAPRGRGALEARSRLACRSGARRRARLAKVDNSEIVSAGLNTRAEVLSHCPVHGELELKVVDPPNSSLSIHSGFDHVLAVIRDPGSRSGTGW